MMTKKNAFRIANLILTLAITLTVSGWIPFTAPVTINSSPEGAPVFKAGEEDPIGVTPFQTYVFLLDKELEIRLDKFYTESIVLNYDSPEDLFFELRPQPVLVYTKPSAEIYEADSGKLAGDTPMDVEVLVDEARDYVIKKKDYYDQNVTISLETQNPQIFELKHRPLITVSTAQDNVEIYENGSFVSKAPMTEEISKPRTFEFRKDGYFSKTVSLTPAQTHEMSYKMSVELNPLPVIEIKATPASAEIFMAGDNKSIGKGSAKVKIAEKTSFTVKADRYYEESFTVEAKSQLATVNLEAMPYVMITSSPSGAKVTMNGKSIGTTPVEQLIEKPVSVELTKEGYLPQTVTLDSNDLRPMITLEEEPPPPPPEPETNAAPVVVEEVVEEPVVAESTGLSPAVIGGIAVAALALIGIIIGFAKKKK
ncbi:PEGA domain-containing protein [Tichowtungia aerotolerans]|uniref:PEGA domain-containing protein n=1 Tax=Tichowtungia aerotolerans TaxID=2697043 RepID=A0A6P1M7D9_9BACT|nr:PEGA domain-containing protein [Tichowtungia aerotolerans]QHI69952.1 PEGA domain-containing protein [Tichowtungia aerotolerans]